MSDKRVLLLLFDRILSHLAYGLLSAAQRQALPLVGGWGKLVGEKTEFGVEGGCVAARTYLSADNLG